MSNRPQVLPKFHGARDGSGCDNPDCGASNRHIRVLSEFEMNRMYPRKDALPQWPFPPQATHACEKCGYCYQGVAGQAELTTGNGDDERPDVDIDEYDWDPSMVYDVTVRDAIDALLDGAPRDEDGQLTVEADELREAVSRHVPGASGDDADEAIASSDLDVSVHNLADFM